MSAFDKLFKQLLRWKKEKTLVITYGRMNPPHRGHALLIEKMHAVAKTLKADHAVIVSHTQWKKTDPLTVFDKVNTLKDMFPDTVVGETSKENPTLIHQLALFQDKYDHIVLVVGEDRVAEFDELLQHYNNKKTKKGVKLFAFKSIKVISAGFRDPDSNDLSGISGTKMRKWAAEGDLNNFIACLPPSYPLEECKRLYARVRRGLR